MLYFVLVPDNPSRTTCSVLNCCVLRRSPAYFFRIPAAVMEWRCAGQTASVNTHINQNRILSAPLSEQSGEATHAFGVNWS